MPIFTGLRFGFGQPNAGGSAGPTAINASGGTKTTFGSYTVHTFTSSGSFVVASGSGNIDYLCVAGGGGGGGRGAGGGAGGLRSTVDDTGGPSPGSLESAVPVVAGSYTITIGAGGEGATNAPNDTQGGETGDNSSLQYNGGTITSLGGGGGGSDGSSAKPGGSGGGGANNKPEASGTDNQGYRGGRAHTDACGGGGGAGGIGSDGHPSGSGNPAGPGGVGVQVLIAGPSTSHPSGQPGPGGGQGWFAGGGGGALGSGQASPGEGGGPGGPYAGAGDGGQGSPTQTNGVSATANTGSGGGGGGGFPEYAGGDGGSGIVVIRYPS